MPCLVKTNWLRQRVTQLSSVGFSIKEIRVTHPSAYLIVSRLSSPVSTDCLELIDNQYQDLIITSSLPPYDWVGLVSSSQYNETYI